MDVRRRWKTIEHDTMYLCVVSVFRIVCRNRYRVVGLVVKASASRAADLGLIPAFTLDLFSRSSHRTGLNIGAPVATLPGVWRHWVSAGTSWPDVSIL